MSRQSIPLSLLHVLTLLALCGSGCKSKTDPRLKTVETARAAHFAEVNKALLKVRNLVLRDTRGLKNLVANLDNYRKADAKLQKNVKRFNVYKLIPVGPQIESYTAALKQYAKTHKLELADVKLLPMPTQRRKLPTSYVGRKAFVYRDNDMLGFVAVGFTWRGAKETRVKQWFHEKLKLGRLLLVDSIRPSANGIRVVGRLVYFYNFKAPVHRAPLISAKKWLAENEVKKPLSVLIKQAETRKLALEIQTELKDIEKLTARANISLQVLSNNHFEEKRWQLFTRYSRKHNAVGWDRARGLLTRKKKRRKPKGKK